MSVNAELLKNCLKNDRRAQLRLYEECYTPMMRVCARYYRNQEDASALLNQGFLKVLDNLDKYKPEVPFEPWIKRIMINCVIDHFRKTKKYKEREDVVDFSEYHSAHPTDVNEAEKEFDAAQLRQFIYQLPEGSQDVFNLHVVDGYSHKEIGKMLGIKEATSRWHLARSRKLLQEMIKQYLTDKSIRA